MLAFIVDGPWYLLKHCLILIFQVQCKKFLSLDVTYYVGNIVDHQMQGNASGGESARHAGDKANFLIDNAWELVRQESVLPEHPPSGSYAVLR